MLAVFPLVRVAGLLCLIGMVMSLPLGWRLRGSPRIIVAVSALAIGAAILLFAASIGDALAALAGLSFGVGGTLATMQLAAGILLCLAAGTSAPAGRAVRS